MTALTTGTASDGGAEKAVRPDGAGPGPVSKPRVLHRVIMPVDRDPDVLKLYVEGNVIHGRPAVVDEAEAAATNGGTNGGTGGATGGGTGTTAPRPAAEAPEDVEDGLRPSAADSAEITGRRGIRVPPGARVSFCTYFNAFPAGHWRRWSVLDEVRLRLTVRGQATVIVYRSTSKGHVQRVDSIDVASAGPVDHEFRLSLMPFIDGGWYWFDILAGGRAANLEQAEWVADSGRPQGHATIGITSFNRPAFCHEQLAMLAGAPDVLDVVDEILVVDQGTDKVEDAEGFPVTAALLGPRLRVIHQANLGGSGGFSRAMAETLAGGRSDYVLLLDDDVIAEPESVLRAVAFGDHARKPTIVGGHMFDLFDRPVLHAYAERIAPYRWWMVPAPGTEYWHNLAQSTLRTTPWLHQRADADFNGWWMCLIPVDVLRRIGLSLPVFIKWDDIEYGVRAKAAGIPTVPLPGAAVWHVPWRDKDNDLDWQSYFQERNRIISALLHSPYGHAGNMIKESFIMVTKHAMAMQYSTAELMLRGIEDVFLGPESLHASIGTKVRALHQVRAGFTDARQRSDIEEFPQVRRRRPPRKGIEGTAPPAGRTDTVRKALVAGLKQLRPVDDFALKHPQTIVPHATQRWWVLSRFDSALVSSADGTKTSWYRRDPKAFRELMRRNSALHARLYMEWNRLARDYRRALPEITAPERWAKTFAEAEAPTEPTETTTRTTTETATDTATDTGAGPE
ncbi:glycosyl transferase [Actinomadura sp. NBRC 104412]|uniref:glycosyltransferase n=1 Tax=Actinomadura sp. NBRC 104412 TaxID=3032203 RepID=UPI00249FA921|nr:glycosyltransferase [Actinomadura sp. NBRC 104412]GLZ07418.1 glycosyl transferase [Actinomadura sp. NBRC 104412]